MAITLQRRVLDINPASGGTTGTTGVTLKRRALVDEQGFKNWYAGHASTLKLNPDPDDPKHQYNYRAAYKAGAVPDVSGHWPSQFKMLGHPNRYVDGIDTITGKPKIQLDFSSPAAALSKNGKPKTNLLGLTLSPSPTMTGIEDKIARALLTRVSPRAGAGVSSFLEQTKGKLHKLFTGQPYLSEEDLANMAKHPIASAVGGIGGGVLSYGATAATGAPLPLAFGAVGGLSELADVAADQDKQKFTGAQKAARVALSAGSSAIIGKIFKDARILKTALKRITSSAVGAGSASVTESLVKNAVSGEKPDVKEALANGAMNFGTLFILGAATEIPAMNRIIIREAEGLTGKKGLNLKQARRVLSDATIQEHQLSPQWQAANQELKVKAAIEDYKIRLGLSTQDAEFLLRSGNVRQRGWILENQIHKNIELAQRYPEQAEFYNNRAALLAQHRKIIAEYGVDPANVFMADAIAKKIRPAQKIKQAAPDRAEAGVKQPEVLEDWFWQRMTPEQKAQFGGQGKEVSQPERSIIEQQKFAGKPAPAQPSPAPKIAPPLDWEEHKAKYPAGAPFDQPGAKLQGKQGIVETHAKLVLKRREIPQFSDEDKNDIKDISDQLYYAEGPQTIKTEEGYKRLRSGWPDYLTDRGYNRKALNVIFNKARVDKPLTGKQHARMSEILSDYRAMKANVDREIETVDNELAQLRVEFPDITDEEIAGLAKEVENEWDDNRYAVAREKFIAKKAGRPESQGPVLSAKETKPAQPDQEVKFTGAAQPPEESKVTPSGQVRLEMLPPPQTELFQESGELFTGKTRPPAIKEEQQPAKFTGKIADFGEKIGGARKDTATKTGPILLKKREITEGVEPWRGKYTAVESVYNKGQWSIIKKSKDRFAFGSRSTVFSSKEEAEKAIPIYAVNDTHRVYQDADKKWVIYKRVGPRKLFKVVNKQFDEREEAVKYMAQNAEKILNIKTTFGEEILPVPDIAVRKGPQRRTKDADAEMFMATFAPRGIEFGNWNNAEERQLVLNHAYDGLMDLAEALGLSPKDLMLNGELGIAFGARGQGLSGAKAHYESTYGVINLTKMKGAGSLAHEWFHALDNHLARLDGKTSSERVKDVRGNMVFSARTSSDSMLSFGSGLRSKLDKDLLATYKTLIDSMLRKAETYVEDTKVADKFLLKAKEHLKEKIDKIRLNLEKDLTKEYTWRKNATGLKPAGQEQLSEFDKLAAIFLEGGNLDLKYIIPEGSKSKYTGRNTNDALEAISKIMKAVRNRNGFSATGDGILDRLAASIRLYRQRLDMFKEAQNKVEKTKQVPTNYAIEARKMDQARTGDYWSHPHEMAARAFSSYVEDKFALSALQSDFMVYHAHGGILLPMIDGFVARPYPEGQERDIINKEFDKFFKRVNSILDRATKTVQEIAPASGKFTGKALPTRQTLRITADTTITDVQGNDRTLPKGEEYAFFDIGEGKVRLQDGQQVTVYEGELSKINGKIAGEGDIKAGGKMHFMPPEEIQKFAGKAKPAGEYVYKKQTPIAKKEEAPPPATVPDTTVNGKGDVEVQPELFKDMLPPPRKDIGWQDLVDPDFLQQPKKKTTILQYWTPAEYHLKQLGFDEKIGKPLRESMQEFSIEYTKKLDVLAKIHNEFKEGLKKYNANPARQGKPMDLKAAGQILWDLMDKGDPMDADAIDMRYIEELKQQHKDQNVDFMIKAAREYRKGTNEMLKRMNIVRALIGDEPIKGVKNYILHMLKPEYLNEIFSRGVIPTELAKAMEYIPPKNVFLRTAIKRKGVPEEWLLKDPYVLMKAMYAIDLRYIHLQKALHQVEPYLKAVEHHRGETFLDEWSPETYKYLDDWIKQAIKMRPSTIDVLIDNLLEYTIAPILRATGLRVSHMPWRDFVSLISAGAHTGALGMRIKPVLRNLVQTTFDWVMYGTKSYLKGSNAFLTKEGFKILKQTNTWRTRIPYEAQDSAFLHKIFKVGGVGYIWSDLHNVGKGLLTMYYHARDVLGYSHEKAIKFADTELPRTQWSYRREDLPRAYWTTTGRFFWTLGSWWMNYYTSFLPEILRRTFKGVDVSGRKVPVVERLGGLRLLVLLGLLYGIKYASKELTGTTVDYTGELTPTPMRGSPMASTSASMIKISQGLTDRNDRMLKEGLRELSRTIDIYIPFDLAVRDLFDVVTGKKMPAQLFFYGKQKKVKRRDSGGLPSLPSRKFSGMPKRF